LRGEFQRRFMQEEIVGKINELSEKLEDIRGFL
jgi:hypothetical protein